jgi:hypothetical protein
MPHAGKQGRRVVSAIRRDEGTGTVWIGGRACLLIEGVVNP